MYNKTFLDAVSQYLYNYIYLTVAMWKYMVVQAPLLPVSIDKYIYKELVDGLISLI